MKTQRDVVMCGITGFVGQRAEMQQILQEMMDLIAHRGPDGQGQFVEGPAALGQRRLSIIDLEGGKQPMFNEDENLVVVFNGEIYNFQELSEELKAAGHTFATRSDTEVLLHGYEQWGKELLPRLRGMFAFAIWDRRLQTLFCARDHFGIKPLYYYQAEDGLNVKWYLIGYGSDEPLIRRKIAEAGMQDRVIILGKKGNPYPYMRACDLYVQPSRYEGKAVTVREAQLLEKPVVITDYATSGSQLEDGADGVIVPMDNAGCAAGIAALLRDPTRMQQLSENCAKRDYTNSAEVEKIYALME